LPANATPGVWPYDDLPPAPKTESDKPRAAAKHGKHAKAPASADAGDARPPFAKNKKPKRDKPGFKAAAKPAKPHRKGPPSDAARSGTGSEGGKGGLKRKPKS
jgi:ATP-dependent RNA helicase DeaD